MEGTNNFTFLTLRGFILLTLDMFMEPEQTDFQRQRIFILNGEHTHGGN